MHETFSGPLERDKDGTWWYVHVPAEVRYKLKDYEHRGIIKVVVTIGDTSWDGSILPWADGSGQISMNKQVRTQESLELGEILTVKIQPR